MSVSGALPSYVTPHGDDGGDAGAAALREVNLRTVDANDAAYARVSALWVELDGAPVTDDRWGVGLVEELRFKVGVRAHGDARLLVGDEEIPLQPTDVITIRDFNGRFTFENVGTPDAAIALDGTVKTTSVQDGAARRVSTEYVGDATDRQSANGGAGGGDDGGARVGYVVLGANGQETVGVERGEGRPLATQTHSEGPPKTVNVFASDVRVNGAPVREYLHGDGALDEVVFEVAYTGGSPYVLNWSGAAEPLRPGATVTVTDFVGSYLVFQVQNGVSRIRLDGYAASVDLIDPGAAPTDAQAGNEAPVAQFKASPDNPTTSEWVTFSDHSYDPDGVIVLYQWSFGDGETSTTRNPRHRYDEAGVYHVTLTVTDERLRTNQTEAVVTVGNTPPVADFDFTPSAPTDLRPVSFINKAWDPDGEIVGYHWAFGDGATSNEKAPKHTYPDDGEYEATLTVTDEDGGSDSITKVIVVHNVPPRPNFEVDPANPVTLESVRFTDTSVDGDGEIVERAWDFGSAGAATTANATITFTSPGLYPVSLTVTDDDGDTATVTRDVYVDNRPPEAIFEWTPQTPVTGALVQFQDHSVDRDGALTAWQWDFGDGATSGLRHPTHRFADRGNHTVTLTVTDDQGATHTSERTVTIANAPPVAEFTWNPREPNTRRAVGFVDQSSDADGAGTIVSRVWDFGDGNTSTAHEPSHAFWDDGNYTVTLTVTDDRGETSTRTRTVNVLNRPPGVTASVTPTNPTSRTPLHLDMDASDVDGAVVLTHWLLPNGTTLAGPDATTTLPAGTHDLVAVAVDDDGGRSAVTVSIHVRPAPPIAAFTVDPAVPSAGRPAEYLDASVPGDAPIVWWQWTFDDGNRTRAPNATHTFLEDGDHEVTLRVEDANGLRGRVTRTIRVNAPPVVDFTISDAQPSAGQTVVFNSTSHDPDGALESLEWRFGDGSAAEAGEGATHQYATSGVYEVTLTATDSDGATTTATKTVVVANKAPVAAFTHTGPVQAGQAVQFTDESSDADGTVQSWSWDFGDGATSAQQNPSHTFVTSAIHQVTLTVTDDKGRPGTAVEDVRVVNDHPLDVRVRVIYPDGEPVDLTNPFITASLEVAHTGLTFNEGGGTGGAHPLAVNESGWATATVAATEWAGGEDLTFTVAPESGTATTATFQAPADATELVEVVVTAFPLRSSVAIAAPQRGGVSELPQLPPDATKHPTYRDPTEPVNGTVEVEWTTGGGAGAATVTVHTTYLGPWEAAPALNAETRLVKRAQVVTTDADGRANFTAQPPVVDGAYLPGYYVVDAVSEMPLADGTTRRSHARAFFAVDPHGALTTAGLLA